MNIINVVFSLPTLPCSYWLLLLSLGFLHSKLIPPVFTEHPVCTGHLPNPHTLPQAQSPDLSRSWAPSLGALIQPSWLRNL